MVSVQPGGTIGILGGGQLGRMTALAAARLGYKTHIFCPEPDAPALQVSPLHTQASWGNKKALAAFASSVDVVTLEWENIPVDTIFFLSQYTSVCPGAFVLEISQDRIQEKTFARKCGIRTADFLPIESLKELKAAVVEMGTNTILKSARMGYDGKGQVRLSPDTDLAHAWADVGGVSAVLESLVDFSNEVSVIVARRHDGVMTSYPVVENIHKNQILFETIAPAELSTALCEEARAAACRMADSLQIVGLLAVEFFVLKQPDKGGASVLLNEIAPRPHNSGHWTIDACACSQFEQLVRAICGLPLGGTEPLCKSIMRNLLGHEIDAWPEYLADQTACLHLYGKNQVREGRKMGHVTFLKK